MLTLNISLRRRLPTTIASLKRHLSSGLVYSIDNLECDRIAQQVQNHGFGMTSTSVLSETAVDAIRLKMPDLFRGEFETGVYPDEWHWR